MTLWRFKKQAFNDPDRFPKGWHLANDAKGQSGEFTLCGIAFDGDANFPSSNVLNTIDIKKDGKVTCEDCLAIIALCKSVKL